jgi:hypothetical protein
LHWRLGGTQRRSELGGEEENSHPLPGLEPQSENTKGRIHIEDLGIDGRIILRWILK